MCRSQREGRQHRHFQARTVLFTQLGEHGCRRRARERTAPDVLWMLLSWRLDHKLAGSLEPSQTATQFGDIKVFREETRFFFFFFSSPCSSLCTVELSLWLEHGLLFEKLKVLIIFEVEAGFFGGSKKKYCLCVKVHKVRTQERLIQWWICFCFFTLIRNAFRTQAYILLPAQYACGCWKKMLKHQCFKIIII